MPEFVRGKAERATRKRALAPDLARGVMLLIIATVHALMYRQMVSAGTGSGIDTAVVFGMTLLGENRGYPMFAALFGYGLMQIYRKGQGKALDSPLKPIRARGRWLIAIGLAHTVLLSYGDILSVYGLAALMFGGLLAASDRCIAMTGAVALILGSAAYTLVMVGIFFAQMPEAGLAETTPIFDALMRLAAWPVTVLSFLAISIFPLTIGMLAARYGLLENIGRHRRLLIAVAVGGIGAAIVGGLPHALAVTGWWQPSSEMGLSAAWLHLVTGYAGGFGYAALIAIIAERIGARRGPVVSALAATGRASMTCYLLQSVAWVALFMPYTLDIGESISYLQAVLIGAAVWLVTVVLAAALQRWGVPGPAEAFLRGRLSSAGAK